MTQGAFRATLKVAFGRDQIDHIRGALMRRSALLSELWAGLVARWVPAVDAACDDHWSVYRPFTNRTTSGRQQRS